jgi:flagellar biosynthesis protein FlhF
MRLIRAELGPEAVILHTQKVEPRGLAGLWRKPRVEVLAALGSAADARSPRPAAGNDLRQEVDEVKATLSSLAGSLLAAGLVDVTLAGAAPNELRQTLLARGIADLWAGEISAAVAGELSARAQRDPQAVMECGRRHLRRRILTTGLLGPLAAGGAPRSGIIVLVGPTGVGKTTTVAKLGARLRQRSPVAVVTTDTHRVAAAAQLLAYCQILGLPAAVAYTPEELAEKVRALQQEGASLVLVDTPGRNPRNEEHIQELRNFVEALPERTVHLVVSATTSDQEFQHIVEGFGCVAPSGLILTKTDEAGCLGAAFNAMMSAQLPFSLLSTGQRVPDDMEAATAERLADLMLPPEAAPSGGDAS